MRNSWNRYRLLASAVLALSLAGCDPSQPASAPDELPEQATAPALPAPPLPQAAPQAAPAPPPLTREEQRVRLLIEQVEQAYAFGEAAYRKGNLVEAKVEFDRAVDLMLTSGIDIKRRFALAGRVRPHRGWRERAGDGGAETGQWICAQGRALAGRGGQRRDLRGGPQHCGQGQDASWPPPSRICRWW